MASYAELARKYKDFMVPAMEIIIGNGKKLSTDLKCVTAGVNISLSLTDVSTVSFQIGDCYDLVSRSLKAAVKNNLKLGSKIEVKIGYGSSLTSVFKGYIDSLNLSYSAENGFTYDVSASDVLKLLKEGGKRRREFRKKTYSEIFTELMGSYSGLCSADADPRQDNLEKAVLQDSSDYDFIMTDLIEKGASDFEFVVLLGVAYFRKKSEAKKIVATLKPGEGLKSCGFGFHYLKREITVLGYSHDMQDFTATAQAAAGHLDSGAVKGTEVLVIQAKDQGQVTKKANSYAKELVDRSKSGSLSVIGIPELIPGSYVTIKDVDAMVSGTYHITGVKHSLGNGGFTSDLTIGG